MKIISKIILIFSLIIIIFVTYFSLVGFKTDRFNNQIKNKFTSFNKDLELELNQVNLKLDLFKLKINIKTLGPKIISKNKELEIESIKSKISIISLFKSEFLIQNIDISTKSINVKDLIAFIKTFHNKPQILILEKLFQIKGFLIADLKIDFDSKGNIKKNYSAKGYAKDIELNLFNDYKLNELNFVFKFEKNEFQLKDIDFSLNDFEFFSKTINVKKNEQGFLLKGLLSNKIIELDKNYLLSLKEKFFPQLDFEKIKFSSKNEFLLNLDKNFKITNKYFFSNIDIKEFEITNNFDLKDFFPKINDKIVIKNNNVKLEYDTKKFIVEGKGEIYLQNNNDYIDYKIEKLDQLINFKSLIKLNKDPFFINFLNFEKDRNYETKIQLNGYRNSKKKIFLKSIKLDENKNTIEGKNIEFSSKFKIKSIKNFNANYVDSQDQKNIFNIKKNNKRYVLQGSDFNGDNLLKNILVGDENKDYFNEDFELILKIGNVRLDSEFNLKNLSGNLKFKKQKLYEGNLEGDFTKQKKMKFTAKTSGNKTITTLFLDFAKPIIKKYKFIKGFDNGILDFYSIRNGDVSNSTLKIYDFKLKEIPTLTKLLTLASLQGIADILSGEGIRFDEFEMYFENKKNLMNINEIYAIGPAISVLMNGYVEKNKLISLRGTLVPATTINKVIGTIPVLGKILVGSKTGEGVFGVSFKIKGPPKNLETSVNPIKTLTPRFITRTLEKINKN